MKPVVLRLEILQALDLVTLQAAELLAPAVIRHLADADRADRFRDALTLRGQHINLPQLGDDLFRLVALPRHHGPPWLNHSSGWPASSTGPNITFRLLDRPDGPCRLIVGTSSRAAINADACECHSAWNLRRGASNASTVRH